MLQRNRKKNKQTRIHIETENSLNSQNNPEEKKNNCGIVIPYVKQYYIVII